MAMEYYRLVSAKVNGGQSAKLSAAVRGQAGRGSHSGRQMSAGCGRAEIRDFLPARFCGRPRADLLLARQSGTLLPSCARPKRHVDI